MNKDVYPQDVDLQYKIRCSAHNLKPYVYCEMCMVRSQLHEIKDEVFRDARFMISQVSISLHEIHKTLDVYRKQIAELQIEVQLLKDKKS